MHGVTAVRKEFDPRDIPGCRGWLRADKGITTVDGLVSLWTNQVSGVSGNASQATASFRPTYNAGGAGPANRPHLDCPSAGPVLVWDLTVAGAKTIACVARIDSTGSGFSVYSLNEGSAETTSEMILGLGGYHSVSFRHDYGTSAGAAVGHDDVLGTGIHGYIQTYNGSGNSNAANYTATYDGVTKTLTTTGLFGASAGRFGTLVARNTSPTFGLNGDIFELIVYDRVLTATELASLWGYIKTRYGL